MEMPFEANTFDAVYAIEATCHAPVFEGVYVFNMDSLTLDFILME
jgi:hypothetical protein